MRGRTAPSPYTSYRPFFHRPPHIAPTPCARSFIRAIASSPRSMVVTTSPSGTGCSLLPKPWGSKSLCQAKCNSTTMLLRIGPYARTRRWLGCRCSATHCGRSRAPSRRARTPSRGSDLGRGAVGQVAPGAADAPLQERRVGAAGQQLLVVVAFEQQRGATGQFLQHVCAG